MNDDITTIDRCLLEPVEHNLGAEQLSPQLDEELRWKCLELLLRLGQRPPRSPARSLRQLIFYLANSYEGAHSSRIDALCCGLHRMSSGDFRGALSMFEQVLTGRVDADFEPIREVALELHAQCLQQLDYDEQALEEFTHLLHRKFEETRDSGQADHIARLLGLGA
jgi:hypothetical protein